MSTFRFLAEKLKGYSIAHLIRVECESLCFGLTAWIPTLLGFIVRACVAKLFFASCRGFCWIQPRVMLVETGRIRIGKNFAVNSGSYINGLGGIDFGDDVLIGSNVTISSGQHPIDGKTPSVFARSSIPKKIIVEDDVWIGAGAVIMPGVRLARGSVVGANAVVTHDTEEYSVNAGVPARRLRYR